MPGTTSAVHAILCAGVLAGTLVGPAPAQQPLTAPLTVVTRPYDRLQLLAGSAAAAPTRAGRALWLQRCAFCHDGVGQPTYRTMGPWLGEETVRTLGPVAIRAIIAAGTERMPGFRYDLRPQQVEQLIDFLKSVPADQKPTPAQLALRSSGSALPAGAD